LYQKKNEYIVYNKLILKKIYNKLNSSNNTQ